MSIDISHETEARITDEARRQGVSVDALLERLMSERGAAAHVVTGNGATPKVPILHPGVIARFTGATSMTMSVEPGVLDANVLAYAVDADAPQHAASRALLDAAGDPSTTLYVTSQILCEFYSIIANPRRVRVVCSSAEALGIISPVLALPGLFVLPTPARAVAGWMQLLQRHPVTGGDVFDLQIVATMQANGLQRIYTFNADDFEVFPELAGLTP